MVALLLAGCARTPDASPTAAAPEPRLPFYNSASFDAEWIAPTDPAYTHIHQIDTFAMTNQAGHRITSDSLRGRIYVASFFFTTCTSICPKMTGNLLAVQDSFAQDDRVRLVSFSVMPWVDQVPQLAEYGEINGINPQRWWLLTGDKDRIYTLGRKSFFAEKDLGLAKTNDEFLHTESMLLIDGHARIRGIYNATQKVDLERIVEDMRVLLRES